MRDCKPSDRRPVIWRSSSSRHVVKSSSVKAMEASTTSCVAVAWLGEFVPWRLLGMASTWWRLRGLGAWWRSMGGIFWIGVYGGGAGVLFAAEAGDGAPSGAVCREGGDFEGAGDG